MVDRWGWSWFQGPHWPTTDGVVPFHEFQRVRRTLPRLWAREQLNTAMGIALALTPDDRGGDQLRRDALKAAHGA